MAEPKKKYKEEPKGSYKAGESWYSKYKGMGIYNDNDQISTKANKTRRYLQDQERKTGVKATQPAKQAGMRNKDGSLWSPQTDMGKDLFRKKTLEKNDRRRTNAAKQSSGYGSKKSESLGNFSARAMKSTDLSQKLRKAYVDKKVNDSVKNMDRDKKVLMNAINKQKRR